jgi:hypothetical protein
LPNEEGIVPVNLLPSSKSDSERNKKKTSANYVKKYAKRNMCARTKLGQLAQL